MQVPASTHETTCLGPLEGTLRRALASLHPVFHRVYARLVRPGRGVLELVSVPLSACVCSVCRDMQVCGHG